MLKFLLAYHVLPLSASNMMHGQQMKLDQIRKITPNHTMNTLINNHGGIKDQGGKMFEI